MVASTQHGASVGRGDLDPYPALRLRTVRSMGRGPSYSFGPQSFVMEDGGDRGGRAAFKRLIKSDPSDGPRAYGVARARPLRDNRQHGEER